MDAGPRALLLFEAPAGFGKTWSLLQVCEAARRARRTVAWVGLRPSVTSPLAFARKLAATLNTRGVAGLHRGPAAESRETENDRLAFVAALTHGIQQHRHPVLLVLDDYNSVDDEAVDAMLGQLLEQQPSNLTVALASRRTCPVPLSRLLLEGRLLRVEKRELHFSRSETREFFGRTLSPAATSRIHRLTEGWPAALQMASVCAGEWRGTGTDIYNAPGFARLIGEYCRTEVLGHADPAALDLLTECSIIEVLEPGACDAIRGRDNSSQVLARLAGRETFMEPVSVARNSWRVPLLLNQTLRRRMGEQGARAVAAAHLPVAQYYQSAGMLLEALHHYVEAGKPAAAAEALERASPMGLIVAHGDTYGRRLLESVPQALQVNFPRLVVMRAYLDYKQGLLDQARTALADLAVRTGNFTADRPGGDDTQLRVEAVCVEVYMEYYRRSLAPVAYLRQLEQDLAVVGKGDPGLVALFRFVTGGLYKMRGDFESTESLYVQIEQLAARYDAGWMTVWLKYHFGLLALARGQLAEARYLLHAGLKLWRSGFPTDATYRAVARIALAEADYESDAVGEAQAKLDESLYTAEHIEGWFEPYAAVYETAMMIQLQAGRADEAESLLARAAAIPRVALLLERFLGVLRLRLELLRGRPEAAQRILDEAGLATKWWSPAFQDELTYREWDLVGLCLAQLAIRRGSFDEARRTVDRLGQVARLSGRARTVAQVAILRAVMAWKEGDARRAVAELLPAIELGHAHGFRRVFLDEGEDVQPVLAAAAAGSDPAIPGHLVSYAAGLCGSLSRKVRDAGSDGASRLSEREQEVMRELCLGHSDKLIARKLGLSAPTVKFHVRNVFRKLGVHKRAAAVAVAHRRGWL